MSEWGSWNSIFLYFLFEFSVRKPHFHIKIENRLATIFVQGDEISDFVA